MRQTLFFVLIVSTTLFACAPSDRAIQTAIADTKTARVIQEITSTNTHVFHTRTPTTSRAVELTITSTSALPDDTPNIDFAISFRSGEDQTKQSIEAMNADGSERKIIYTGGWGKFDWSSDGKQLALVERGEQGASQIVLWEVDTATKRVVVAEEIELSGLMTRYYGYLTPRFLSDQQIYFLVLYPRVGSDIRRLTVGGQITGLPSAIIQEWVGRSGLDVSPSGMVAFQTFGNSPPNLGNGLSIFDTQTRKTTVIIPIQYIGIGTPAWSSDGEWIAFSASSSEGNDFEGPTSIWIIKKDGSGLQKLISGESNYALEDPAWSPDGKWIAFARIRISASSDRRDGDIWIASVDGGNVFNLTSTSDIFETNPEWIPIRLP